MRFLIRNCGLIFLSVTLLVGCASPPVVGNVNPTVTVPPTQSVVFGDIERNFDLNPGRNGFVRLIDPTHSSPLVKQSLHSRMTWFCWHLPPGKYAIVNFNTENTTYAGTATRFDAEGLKPEGWLPIRLVNPKESWPLCAEFEVSGAGQTIYLGRLELNMEQNQLTASVTNDFDHAVELLKGSYPHHDSEPVKALLKVRDDK
jgi:hypothetical protein